MNMKEVKVTISLADLCDLKDEAEVKKIYEDWYKKAEKEAADLKAKYEPEPTTEEK